MDPLRMEDHLESKCTKVMEIDEEENIDPLEMIEAMNKDRETDGYFAEEGNFDQNQNCLSDPYGPSLVPNTTGKSDSSVDRAASTAVLGINDRPNSPTETEGRQETSMQSSSDHSDHNHENRDEIEPTTNHKSKDSDTAGKDPNKSDSKIGDAEDGSPTQDNTQDDFFKNIDDSTLTKKRQLMDERKRKLLLLCKQEEEKAKMEEEDLSNTEDNDPNHPDSNSSDVDKDVDDSPTEDHTEDNVIKNTKDSASTKKRQLMDERKRKLLLLCKQEEEKETMEEEEKKRLTEESGAVKIGSSRFNKKKRKVIVDEDDEDSDDSEEEPKAKSPEKSSDENTLKSIVMDDDEESEYEESGEEGMDKATKVKVSKSQLDQIQEESQALKEELDQINGEIANMKTETEKQDKKSEKEDTRATFRKKKWNKNEDLSKTQAVLRKRSTKKQVKVTRNYKKINQTLDGIFKRINDRAQNIAPSRVMVNYARRYGRLPEIPAIEFRSPTEKASKESLYKQMTVLEEDLADKPTLEGYIGWEELQQKRKFESEQTNKTNAAAELAGSKVENGLSTVDAVKSEPIEKEKIKLTFDNVKTCDGSSSDEESSEEEFYICPPPKLGEKNHNKKTRTLAVAGLSPMVKRKNRQALRQKLIENTKQRKGPSYESYEPSCEFAPPVKIDVSLGTNEEADEMEEEEEEDTGMISDEEELLQKMRTDQDEFDEDCEEEEEGENNDSEEDEDIERGEEKEDEQEEEQSEAVTNKSELPEPTHIEATKKTMHPIFAKPKNIVRSKSKADSMELQLRLEHTQCIDTDVQNSNKTKEDLSTEKSESQPLSRTQSYGADIDIGNDKEDSKIPNTVITESLHLDHTQYVDTKVQTETQNSEIGARKVGLPVDVTKAPSPSIPETLPIPDTLPINEKTQSSVESSYEETQTLEIPSQADSETEDSLKRPLLSQDMKAARRESLGSETTQGGSNEHVLNQSQGESVSNSQEDQQTDFRAKISSIVEDEAEESDDCKGILPEDEEIDDENEEGDLADLVAPEDEIQAEMEEAERILEADRILEEEHIEEEAELKALEERFVRGGQKNHKKAKLKAQEENFEEDEGVKLKFEQIEEEEGRKLNTWEKKLIQAEELCIQSEDRGLISDSEDEDEDEIKSRLERKVSIIDFEESQGSQRLLTRIESERSSQAIFSMTRKTNLARSRSTGSSASNFEAFNKSIAMDRPTLKRKHSFIGKPLTERQTSILSRRASSTSLCAFSGGSKKSKLRKIHRSSSRSFVFARDFDTASLPGGKPPLSRSLSRPPLQRSVSLATVRSTGSSNSSSKSSDGGSLFAALAKTRYKRPTRK
eukprot:jgi/Bigna1/86174/estExt_fgenesh1_pg.C_80241